MMDSAYLTTYTKVSYFSDFRKLAGNDDDDDNDDDGYDEHDGV